MKITRRVCWFMTGRTIGNASVIRTGLWVFLPILFVEQYFKKYREETKDFKAIPIAKFSYWSIEKETKSKKE